MYLGLDIGSSSSKAVLLGENQESLAAQVVNLGTGTKGVGQVLEAVYRQAGIGPEEVRYTVVTGYGRMTYQGADRQITEISCHAKGVFHLSSSARTIVDVGGQDTKVIRLGQDGSVENFVMNDKCAAGTGRFLEVMARCWTAPLPPSPSWPNRERKWFPSAISARYSLNQRSSPTSPPVCPRPMWRRVPSHPLPHGSPGWLGVSGWSRRWL